jgi:hypothetical protein
MTRPCATARAAGRHARRGVDVAVAHEDLVGLDREPGVLAGQLIAVAPLRRALAPVEQPGRGEELRQLGLPEHLYGHLLTMAKLHAEGRYDRLTHDVEAILGRPATSAREFVTRHAASFSP